MTQPIMNSQATTVFRSSLLLRLPSLACLSYKLPRPTKPRITPPQNDKQIYYLLKIIYFREKVEYAPLE